MALLVGAAAVVQTGPQEEVERLVRGAMEETVVPPMVVVVAVKAR